MPETIQDIESYNWDRLRRGEPASLAWLYDRFFGVLYNYGRKLCADTKSVEDGIHDLFVDLWRFRANLSPTTSVRFYLYRSLRRKLLRNTAGEVSLIKNGVIPDHLLQTAPCEEQVTIERETDDRRLSHLKKLLDDLSPRQYEAMTLRFYDELSFVEIGEILGVNEQSARNLVQRGLTQLKQYSKLLLTWSLLFIS